MRAVRVGSRVGAAEESGVLAIRGWLPLRKGEYWQRVGLSWALSAAKGRDS